MNKKNTPENNSSHESVESSSSSSNERPKHDELFKKVMSEPIAANEFLEHYLPVSFKNKINLDSIKIEKESFVTEDLRKRLSLSNKVVPFLRNLVVPFYLTMTLEKY